MNNNCHLRKTSIIFRREHSRQFLSRLERVRAFELGRCSSRCALRSRWDWSSA